MFVILRVVVCWLVLTAGAIAVAADLSSAVVIVPENASSRVHKAATMLVEEVEKRTGIRWKLANKPPANDTSSVSLSTFAGPQTKAEGFHVELWKVAGSAN